MITEGAIEGCAHFLGKPGWFPFLNAEVKNILSQFPIEELGGICENVVNWWTNNVANLDLTQITKDELAFKKAMKKSQSD